MPVTFGPVAWFRWLSGRDLEDQAASLVARIRERIGAHHRAETSEVVGALARGGRSTADWVAQLSRATDGAASFRVPAVPADVLLAVACDETAPAAARVGAAIALRRASQDHAIRDRVRVAAEACAEPKLRVALEKAATADDDALFDALDAFDEPDAFDRSGASRGAESGNASEARPALSRSQIGH